MNAGLTLRAIEWLITLAIARWSHIPRSEQWAGVQSINNNFN